MRRRVMCGFCGGVCGRILWDGLWFSFLGCRKMKEGEQIPCGILARYLCL